MDIRLHDSLTKEMQVLQPVVPGQVSLYLCGPTVYDRAHLGNARNVIVFDVLTRLLRHVYGAANVRYVRNVTDVDDRINETAQARKAQGAPGTVEELIAERADETVAWYRADMAALGCAPPDAEPRATEHIADMIAMIETLLMKNHAYVAEGHVLFDVASDEGYGRLSRRSVDDMIAGARVEVAPYKRHPMDFVLWKPSGPDLPGWDSPWGRGRPGWHIECSAMSRALLGEAFDIHGGGLDLQFPHHENEIAQSRCANDDARFASIWLHNEMLQVEGRKMSKSLGNFFTVRDLLDQGVPGEVIRYVFLQTHYSKPMDWTDAKRTEAERVLRKWRGQVTGVAPGTPSPAVLEALADDINTPKALAELHILSSAGDAAALVASARMLGLLTEALGGWTEVADEAQARLHALAEAFMAERARAKEIKDFSRVDHLKRALAEAGVEVRMRADGVDLVPGPDTRLENLMKIDV